MRYYSSTAGAMTLTAGVGAGDTTLAVNTVVGLPASFPYTLVVEPGVSGQEEIVTVTAAAGTSLTVTRGQDSTTGVTHALGSAVRHMMTARDLREAREHEAKTTGAHGITGAPVGTTDVQTLDNKTFQASGDYTALTARAAASQTAPTFAVKTSAGADAWYATSSQWQSDAVALQTKGGADLYGMVAHVKPPSGKDGVVVDHATGTTGYAWKGQKAGVNKSLIDLDGNATLGTITSPTITALTDADTALDGRLDTIEGNLGAQTTFAATSAAKDGKQIHWGALTTAVPDANGFATVTHSAGFTPTVIHVQSTAPASLYAVAIGVDTITATTFRVRFFGWNTGTSYSAAAVPISFVCME